MNKEISDIFKDKLENFEGEVPDGLWSKLEQNPKWQSHLRRQKRRNIALYSVFAVVAIAASILLIHNRMSNSTSSDELSGDETVMVQEPVTENVPTQAVANDEALSEETEESVLDPETIIPFGEDTPVVNPSSEESIETTVANEVKVSQAQLTENIGKTEAKTASKDVAGKKDVTGNKSGNQNTTTTSEPATQQPSSEPAEYHSPFLIPNAFTPNGDGLNDIFIPVANGDVQSYQMDIYSRSGQKLFSTRSLYQGWNGEFQGANQISGAYVYVIKYKDDNGKEHIEKGQLTLIR